MTLQLLSSNDEFSVFESSSNYVNLLFLCIAWNRPGESHRLVKAELSLKIPPQQGVQVEPIGKREPPTHKEGRKGYQGLISRHFF